MLFNFALNPIDEIAPWGESTDLHLHWFGLTSGDYHLQAGSEQLLRHSDECLRQFACPEAHPSPFVEYYVARLHQDILEIAHRILEPIPAELAPYASSSRYLTWRSECARWLDSKSEDDHAAWELSCNAKMWLSQRSLDTGYLSTCARTWFWRLDDTIHIEWDNRNQRFEGVTAWSALLGSHCLAVDDFLAELGGFHGRLIEAMRGRVEEVCQSWSRPEIRIDLDQLRAEQVIWDCPIERLIPHEEPTDWQAVIAAIRHIESYADD